MIRTETVPTPFSDTKYVQNKHCSEYRANSNLQTTFISIKPSAELRLKKRLPVISKHDSKMFHKSSLHIHTFKVTSNKKKRTDE